MAGGCSKSHTIRMLKINEKTKVYLACGDTDMRKQINGLMAMVENSFHLEPYENAMFVFCNRSRNRLKILLWEDNGYWLLLKRLERGHFKWPKAGTEQTMNLSLEDLKGLIRAPGLLQKLKRNEVLKS